MGQGAGFAMSLIPAPFVVLSIPVLIGTRRSVDSWLYMAPTDQSGPIFNLRCSSSVLRVSC